MKYKIIVDKQPKNNPSDEKKEYEIDIEELKITEDGTVYDSLIITRNEDYVIRRCSLSAFGVVEILQEPIKEPINDINIKLFKGDNYIYLVDPVGNRIVAEYLIENEFTDMYVTDTEMNTAITQSESKIELSVNQKLDGYATKVEMNASLSLTTENIMSEVNKKVDEEEFGTKITQNIESVQIAWNQISQYIQMMIINQKASLAILDSSDNLVTSFDQDGQHFYKDRNEVFGEMGVKEVDNQKYITFSVPTDYNKDIDDGMAWGITTTSDNKFFPILFIRNFHMGAKQSDDFGGELILNSCNLVLGGAGSGIVSGNVIMNSDFLNNLMFSDANTGNILLNIIPPNSVLEGMENGYISILSNIEFYANAGGSNSFKIGDENNYILMSDTGDFHVQGSGGAMFGVSGKGVGFDVYPKIAANIWGTLDVDGNVFANNISSDRRLKKNIKDSNTCALDIIKQITHRQFDMKKDNKHYKIGYIAQELETIEPNFILKREKTAEVEERYYINELPIISTITKAIQEQQEQIEDLKKQVVLLERSI